MKSVVPTRHIARVWCGSDRFSCSILPSPSPCLPEAIWMTRIARLGKVNTVPERTQGEALEGKRMAEVR